jgi:phenylacetate-coenzyme A ligase PaaK-like adenylate-forming protein
MTDLYGRVFQNALYPGWERGLRRRPTLSHLKELERSEWWSLDELGALQTTGLRKLLEHAYNHSPYYRRSFEERALRPDDIRDIDHLRKLPLLTREAAANSFEERMSSAAPLPRIRKMTSGTTGRPLAFAYDVGSEYWRQATKLRGYGWAGYRPGDRSLHFWGSIAAVQAAPLKKKVKVALDHLVRREHYIDCADHSEEALASVVRRLRELRPKVLVCYAHAGAALARHIVETKSRDWEDIPVISAAERLFPADRDVMTRAFGPGIFETYGSREVMLIAAECAAHGGLHVSMENLAVEIVVREGDAERPALPGELGEVVVTDLHNYGAPFIRYLNGDLAVAMPGARCACGRALSRLQRVEGRETDTLRDGEGRPIGGLFFSVLFSVLADKVRAFQVVQHKDRSIDLKLVPGKSFEDSVLGMVKRNCEKTIPGVDLRLHLVSDIPVGAAGKARVVVVEN